MPTRDSAPLGAPVWIDLSSSDPQRAKDFYGQVFGWTFQDTSEEYGNYVNFSKDGVLVAGMMKNDGTGAPDGWTTYLSSADAKATADAVLTAGGQVLMEPMQVGPQGTMALVTDVGAAVIGIWQPGEHKGFGLVGEAGAPIWHELHTRDYPTIVPFYQRAFGWQTSVMSDTDEFRYTVMEVDGVQYAGVMDSASFLQPGVPSNWQVYLGATDVDATLARIQELGGAVTQPAEDTPFGRLAQATDPMGAHFRLSSLPA
jgi:uncharacterized protein